MNVFVIVTDVGTFKPTPELKEAYEACRLTRKNQPDMRTKAGRRAWNLFKAFQAQKIEELKASA